MANYILDTGIVLGYLTGATYAEEVEATHNVFAPENYTVISIVTEGELLALAMKRRWGKKKLDQLAATLTKIPKIDISHPEIVQRYAEIDAYSDRKHAEKQLEMSARNMGKNDLWVAATASVLEATLITTDHDFDHLDDEFLKVIYINQSS